MHHGAVTKVQQVAGSQTSTLDLVDPRSQSGGGQVTLDHHERHPDVQRLRQAERLLMSGDDHHCLDGLVKNAVNSLPQRSRRDLGEPGQRQAIPSGAGSGLEPEHDAGRTEVIHVRGDHANSPRPPGHQRPGGRVAPVSQLLDRGEHPRPGSRTDRREVVEDPRDGLMGNARDVGHVLHPRRVVTVATPRCVRSSGSVDLRVDLGPRHERIVRRRASRRVAEMVAIEGFSQVRGPGHGLQKDASWRAAETSPGRNLGRRPPHNGFAEPDRRLHTRADLYPAARTRA